MIPQWLSNQRKQMISEFSGPYRFLSNFWYADVELDGVVYPSVEHAYVAAKTIDPKKRVVFTDRTLKPGYVKRMGRSLELRPDWEGVKIHVMENLVRQKFQHPGLKKQLVETQDKELIEGNHWGDRFWGVCKGAGQNNLGKILMKIRDEINKSGP